MNTTKETQAEEQIRENKLKIQRRRYYRKNQEQILDKKRKYYYQNRPEILARNSAYYYANRDEILLKRMQRKREREASLKYFQTIDAVAKLGIHAESLKREKLETAKK